MLKPVYSTFYVSYVCLTKQQERFQPPGKCSQAAFLNHCRVMRKYLAEEIRLPRGISVPGITGDSCQEM